MALRGISGSSAGGTIGGDGFAIGMLPQDGADADPWPVPGPPGAMGATGGIGPAGAPIFLLQEGPDGEPGAPGLPGSTGASGSPGSPGQAGADGATGAVGPVGPAIFLLEEGPEGQPGRPGPSGNDGAPGAAGSSGLPIFVLGDSEPADWGGPVPGPAGAPANQGLLSVAGGLVANTTINDTVTFTTGGITLASQTAAAGSVWRVRARGTFVAVSSATARNAQVACFWGSTQLTAIAVAVQASTARTAAWRVEFDLIGVDTTHVWTTGNLLNTLAAAAYTLSAATPASVAVTAGAQTLDLRFNMSTAVATDQWVIHQVTMERIK